MSALHSRLKTQAQYRDTQEVARETAQASQRQMEHPDCELRQAIWRGKPDHDLDVLLGFGCQDISGYDRPETKRSLLEVVAQATGQMLPNLPLRDDEWEIEDLVPYNPHNTRLRYQEQERPGRPISIRDENEYYMRSLAEAPTYDPDTDPDLYCQQQTARRLFPRRKGKRQPPKPDKDIVQARAMAAVCELLQKWWYPIEFAERVSARSRRIAEEEAAKRLPRTRANHPDELLQQPPLRCWQ